MKKILNVVHYWGGFPIIATSKWLSALKLVEKCADNNCNNWLVLSKKPNDISLITPFIELGCKIIYHPRSNGNFDFASIFRNFVFLRKIRCHIFHCYNDHTSPIIAAKLSNVPVRLWSKLSMSSHYEQGIPPKGIQKLMLSTRITCLFSSKILAISDAAKNEVIAQVGFSNKVTVVDVPVDLERFSVVKSSVIRNEFDLSQSDFVITAVGHFIEVKGWDIAVSAFVKVTKNLPNAKLLLVGKKTSDLFYNKIYSQIEKYRLGGKVVFAGNRNDIPEILQVSDIFILPSRSEGTPAALIEAMASGLSCIATNAGGMPEVIIDGETGFLFERENIDELAEKIILLASDVDLRNKITNNAKIGLEKYSIDTYVNSVFNHYQNLLN